MASKKNVPIAWHPERTISAFELEGEITIPDEPGPERRRAQIKQWRKQNPDKVKKHNEDRDAKRKKIMKEVFEHHHATLEARGVTDESERQGLISNLMYKPPASFESRPDFSTQLNARACEYGGTRAQVEAIDWESIMNHDWSEVAIRRRSRRKSTGGWAPRGQLQPRRQETIATVPAVAHVQAAAAQAAVREPQGDGPSRESNEGPGVGGAQPTEAVDPDPDLNELNEFQSLFY